MAVRLELCAVAMLLATLAGCSGEVDRIPTKGRVLIDGEPLKHGLVQVMPQGARPAYGTLDENGTYVLETYGQNDGTLPGRHPVTVTATEPVDEWHTKWHAPKKYATLAAGLEVEINEDGTASDIELLWEGGRPFVVSNRAD